jgi:FixJ family two-component response regulator
VDTLTPREGDVLALVIAGLLNKQIAATLGISEKTVKVHRARVMQKMQVQSVVHLVLLAERVGLTPPEDLSTPEQSRLSAHPLHA